MRDFARLYDALDATTRTNAKVAAIAAYLGAAAPEDAAWAVFFLTGRRLKRLVSGRTLRAWALRFTGLPEWLVIDAHAAVGDSAETVTLLLDAARRWVGRRACRSIAGSRRASCRCAASRPSTSMRW
jgi:DNA ligase-1